MHLLFLHRVPCATVDVLYLRAMSSILDTYTVYTQCMLLDCLTHICRQGKECRISCVDGLRCDGYKAFEPLGIVESIFNSLPSNFPLS